MDVDDERDGAVRRGMTCPITREHFVDPVFCVGDGHTFERSAIESWFERNDTSPMTGATLTCKALVPNFQARRLADETRPTSLSHEARARQNHLPELRLDASDWRSLVVTVDDVPLPVDRRPEPPAAFVVAGAGRVDVNGAFVRDGFFQGAHAYRRGAFRLTRRRLADGRDWWIVGGVEKTRRRRERPPRRRVLPRAKLRVFTPRARVGERTQRRLAAASRRRRGRARCGRGDERRRNRDSNPRRRRARRRGRPARVVHRLRRGNSKGERRVRSRRDVSGRASV